MIQKLMFPCMFLVSVLTFAATGTAAEHTKDSLEKVRTKLDKKEALLLDVREQKEWDAGHLADAMLVPLSKLTEQGENEKFVEALKKKVPEEKIVYCHCRSGRRTLGAAEILAKLGYDVRPLKPGYEDLLKAGFPPAKEKKP